MLSHHYGVNGGELKKLDTRSFIFDFELLQDMSDPKFVDNLRTCFNKFVNALKDDTLVAGSSDNNNNNVQ